VPDSCALRAPAAAARAALALGSDRTPALASTRRGEL